MIIVHATPKKKEKGVGTRRVFGRGAFVFHTHASPRTSNCKGHIQGKKHRLLSPLDLSDGEGPPSIDSTPFKTVKNQAVALSHLKKRNEQLKLEELRELLAPFRDKRMADLGL